MTIGFSQSKQSKSKKTLQGLLWPRLGTLTALFPQYCTSYTGYGVGFVTWCERRSHKGMNPGR